MEISCRQRISDLGAGGYDRCCEFSEEEWRITLSILGDLASMSRLVAAYTKYPADGKKSAERAIGTLSPDGRSMILAIYTDTFTYQRAPFGPNPNSAEAICASSTSA